MKLPSILEIEQSSVVNPICPVPNPTLSGGFSLLSGALDLVDNH